MPRPMPAAPTRQRLSTLGRPIGVDRAARVIRGMVVAQLGDFKSDGRGSFDEKSLGLIQSLWPKNGLRSRWTHPNESSDGLGKFLGRASNPFLGLAKLEDGREVQALRADLTLDASAFESNPNGNLGEYILALAESDPGALSSSLVLQADRERRLETDGTPKLGADGKPLPPLWRPKKLYAADLVDDGDAVDSILGTNRKDVESLRWTRDYLAQGEALLSKLFAGQSRRVTRARLTAYLNRYLARRYGDEPMNANPKMGLGTAVSGVLNMYLDEAAGDDPNARAGILAQMADAAGNSIDDTIAIVNGEAEPDLPTVEAYAGILGCPLSELVAAWEEDGNGPDSAEEPPAEEPPAEAPPAAGETPAPPVGMSKPGVLRRRLELKMKAGA